MTPSQTPEDFTDVWDTCFDTCRAVVGDSQRAAAEQARRSWLDTLAAMAAGVGERCTLAAYRASAGSGAAAVQPADTALVLGTASHALDYDDVCMLATCHPSAPLVAALLAMLPELMARSPALNWQDLLAAYLVGTETTLRLGEWLGFQHYALGFHATSTLGTVGAAAACAHALGLSRVQAHTALSMAASSACGLRANFGTDVKPLHVGFAAAAAVRAVLLAQAGADASDDVWGDAGFCRAFNGGAAMPRIEWLAGKPLAIEVPGFEHKRFPSCYMTHRLIAGVLAIRERQPAHWGEQVVMEVEVPRNGTSALKYPAPVNGLQGKFSGQYCATAAWVDGQVSLASFTDAAVQRECLQSQRVAVNLRERDDPSERLESAPVSVVVRGVGWVDQITVDWAPGSLADPISRAGLLGKWRDCFAHGGMAPGDAAAAGLLDAPLSENAAAILLPLRDQLCRTIAMHAAGRAAPVQRLS